MIAIISPKDKLPPGRPQTIDIKHHDGQCCKERVANTERLLSHISNPTVYSAIPPALY